MEPKVEAERETGSTLAQSLDKGKVEVKFTKQGIIKQ